MVSKSIKELKFVVNFFSKKKTGSDVFTSGVCNHQEIRVVGDLFRVCLSQIVYSMIPF